MPATSSPTWRDAATGQPVYHPPRASGGGGERRVQPRWHPRGHRERGQDRAGVGRGDRSARYHPPLAHQGVVVSAAFSPDGTPVVTASGDKTARVWDVLLDTGTLPQWSAIAERRPFVLNEHGVRVRRSELRADGASSTVTQGPAVRFQGNGYAQTSFASPSRDGQTSWAAQDGCPRVDRSEPRRTGRYS